MLELLLAIILCGIVAYLLFSGQLGDLFGEKEIAKKAETQIFEPTPETRVPRGEINLQKERSETPIVFKTVSREPAQYHPKGITSEAIVILQNDLGQEEKDGIDYPEILPVRLPYGTRVIR